MGISTFTFKYWKLCDSKLIIENMRNEISANQSGDITTSLVRKWQLSIGKWNARFAFYSFPDSLPRTTFSLWISVFALLLYSLSLSLSLSLILYLLLLSVFYVGLNLSNYNHKETVYFYFYLHYLHAFYRAMEIGKTYQIIIIPFFQTLRAIDNYLYALEGIQM